MDVQQNIWEHLLTPDLFLGLSLLKNLSSVFPHTPFVSLKVQPVPLLIVQSLPSFLGVLLADYGSKHPILLNVYGSYQVWMHVHCKELGIFSSGRVMSKNTEQCHHIAL